MKPGPKELSFVVPGIMSLGPFKGQPVKSLPQWLAGRFQSRACEESQVRIPKRAALGQDLAEQSQRVKYLLLKLLHILTTSYYNLITVFVMKF